MDAHACGGRRFLLQGQVERVVPLIELVIESQLGAAGRENPVIEDFFSSNTTDFLVRRTE